MSAMKISEAVEQIRTLVEINDQVELARLLSDTYRLVVRTKSVEELRFALPATWDFEIPTKLAFAMHIQLLCLLGAEAEDSDRSRFAEFLNAYYEEFDDWASALRSHCVGRKE